MRKELISDEVNAVIKKRGINPTTVANETGVSLDTILRITKRIKTESITDRTEAKILPWLSQNGFPIKKEPSNKSNEIRVYGLAQATTMSNPPCDSAPDIHESDLPSIPWPSIGNRKLVAFKVSGESMSTTLPDGCTIICDCNEEPSNNCLVIAKFDDIAVVKRYRRVGDIILLTSDTPGGKEYERHISKIDWMLRVKQHIVDD